MGPSDVTPSLSYSLFGNDVKRWAINSFHNNVDSVHLFKLRNYHCMTNPINKIAISTTSEICSDQCTPCEYFLRGRTANFKTQPPYQKIYTLWIPKNNNKCFEKVDSRTNFLDWRYSVRHKLFWYRLVKKIRQSKITFYRYRQLKNGDF